MFFGNENQSTRRLGAVELITMRNAKVKCATSSKCEKFKLINVISLFIVVVPILFITTLQQAARSSPPSSSVSVHSWPIRRPRINIAPSTYHPGLDVVSARQPNSDYNTSAAFNPEVTRANEVKGNDSKIGYSTTENRVKLLRENGASDAQQILQKIIRLEDARQTDELFDVKQFVRFFFNEDLATEFGGEKLKRRFKRDYSNHQLLTNETSLTDEIGEEKRARRVRRTKPSNLERFTNTIHSVNPTSNITHLPIMMDASGGSQNPDDSPPSLSSSLPPPMTTSTSTTTTTKSPYRTNRAGGGSRKRGKHSRDSLASRGLIPGPLKNDPNNIHESLTTGLFDDARVDYGSSIAAASSPGNGLMSSLAPQPDDSSSAFAEHQGSSSLADPGSITNEITHDDSSTMLDALANNNNKRDQETLDPYYYNSANKLANIVDADTIAPLAAQAEQELGGGGGYYSSSHGRAAASAAKDVEAKPKVGDAQVLSDHHQQSPDVQSDDQTDSSFLKNLINDPARMEQLLRMLNETTTQKSSTTSHRAAWQLRAPESNPSSMAAAGNRMPNGYYGEMRAPRNSGGLNLNAPYSAELGRISSNNRRSNNNIDNNDHQLNPKIYGPVIPAWTPSKHQAAYSMLYQQQQPRPISIPFQNPTGEFPQELVTNLERNFYSADHQPKQHYSGSMIAQQPIGHKLASVMQKVPLYPLSSSGMTNHNGQTNKTTNGNNLEKQSSTLNSQHVSSQHSAATRQAILQQQQPINYATTFNYRTDNNPASPINLLELPQDVVNQQQQQQPTLGWLRARSPSTINGLGIPLANTNNGQITGSPIVIPTMTTSSLRRTSSSSLGPLASATISRPLSAMFVPGSIAFHSIPFSTSTTTTNRHTRIGGNAQHRVGRIAQNSNSNYEESPGSQAAASSATVSGSSDPMWSDTQNQEDDYQQAPQTIQITAVPNGVGALNGWNGFNGVNGWGNGWNGWGGGPFVNGRPVLLLNQQRQPLVGSSTTSEWRQWILPVAAILALPLVLGSLFVPLFLKSVMFLIQILQMLGLLMPPGQLAGHLASGSHAVSG